MATAKTDKQKLSRTDFRPHVICAVKTYLSDCISSGVYSVVYKYVIIDCYFLDNLIYED